jgi:hypothetical protein
MARPSIEWPIPVYVAELRERVVITFRAPARLLSGRVPPPIVPETVAGQALVCFCLGNGRCLKPAGADRVLSCEYHTAELVTPVRWQPACRPPLRGLFYLRLLTDSQALMRLVRTALAYASDIREQSQYAGSSGCEYRVEPGRKDDGARLLLPRPLREEPWAPGSLFASQEEAEVQLLHPAYHFVPDGTGQVVRAIPVHQYARTTANVRPVALAAPLVASSLGAGPDELIVDHVFFQKRCTHTWSFPPERILAAQTLTGSSLAATRMRGAMRLAA